MSVPVSHLEEQQCRALEKPFEAGQIRQRKGRNGMLGGAEV
jgi:hypothetical protein